MDPKDNCGRDAQVAFFSRLVTLSASVSMKAGSLITTFVSILKKKSIHIRYCTHYFFFFTTGVPKVDKCVFTTLF